MSLKNKDNSVKLEKARLKEEKRLDREGKPETRISLLCGLGG